MTSISSSSLPLRRSLATSWVAAWLFACCALVFAMVVVGGVTRLTHSGLSIVEWQPIVGTIPPLNEAQWLETFGKYQQTPEFKQVNHAMSLAEFKGIFWWEYAHRVLGRVIGLAFFVPLVGFALARKIDRGLALKLGGIFILGGLQGALGWYMVQSGLVDDPRVSQYRLTAHLGLAFLIYAAMFWVGLDLVRGRDARSRDAYAARAPSPGLRRAASALTVLVFVMVLTGGLVAGIRAGFAYNTFPLMNGHIVPPEILSIDPWYLNFFNNMATVQFDHRTLAWILAVVVPWFWIAVRRAAASPRAQTAATWLLGALCIQIALGIATLLLVVPLSLAALHQAGALLVFTAALNARHALDAP
jgi:cytochrome c oxidase assembly protein subunit 15